MSSITERYQQCLNAVAKANSALENGPRKEAEMNQKIAECMAKRNQVMSERKAVDLELNTDQTPGALNTIVKCVAGFALAAGAGYGTAHLAKSIFSKPT